MIDSSLPSVLTLVCKSCLSDCQMRLAGLGVVLAAFLLIAYDVEMVNVQGVIGTMTKDKQKFVSSLVLQIVRSLTILPSSVRSFACALATLFFWCQRGITRHGSLTTQSSALFITFCKLEGPRNDKTGLRTCNL